jgi:hypothetical protein
VFQRTSTCFGDSGAGAVEPGSRPTVVGIQSEDETMCKPGLDDYVFITAPAALRFIQVIG